MNRLPKYWKVKSDNSQKFRDTIERVSNGKIDETETDWAGFIDSMYGTDKRGNITYSGELLHPDAVELSLEEFYALTAEFKKGDMIEVSHGEIGSATSSKSRQRIRYKREFIHYFPQLEFPYLVLNVWGTGGLFFKHARPIKKDIIELTVKVNGKEVALSTVSEETLLEIRKSSE